MRLINLKSTITPCIQCVFKSRWSLRNLLSISIHLQIIFDARTRITYVPFHFHTTYWSRFKRGWWGIADIVRQLLQFATHDYYSTLDISGGITMPFFPASRDVYWWVVLELLQSIKQPTLANRQKTTWKWQYRYLRAYIWPLLCVCFGDEVYVCKKAHIVEPVSLTVLRHTHTNFMILVVGAKTVSPFTKTTGVAWRTPFNGRI